MTATGTYSKATTDRLLEVNGIEIHYNDAGTGPVLLCTHGGGPGANAWDNTKYALPLLAEHFRLLLMDLPNYGESQKHVSPHGQPADVFLATLQRDFLDALGIERASVYGSSAFGATALRFALDFPERTDKVILQAYSPGAGGEPGPGIRTLGAFAADPTAENMQRMCEFFVPRAELRTPEFVQARFAAATAPGHLESRAAFAGNNSDLRPLLSGLRAPVLLVWGEADGMIPIARLLDALPLLPDARAHVWGGGTGHFVIYEHPAEFADVVINFLQR